MDREPITVPLHLKGPVWARGRCCSQQRQTWFDTVGHGIEREIGLCRIAAPAWLRFGDVVVLE
jgi:hypothetical protein